MEYKFTTYGHRNILATHKNTLEFTKDKEISLRGDCIVGVNSDFSLSKIKELILFSKKNSLSKMSIIIEVDKYKEQIIGTINTNFDDNHEIVARKSDFDSKRTLLMKIDKAAVDLDRKMVRFLANPNGKITVCLEILK